MLLLLMSGLIIISITMMIVLVDDGDDGEGVEYSHTIITNHHLALLSLSLSLSLDELQSHPNDKVEHVVVVQYQSLLWVLDPCHRLPSLAHASTCREQASEPAIIDSST